MIIHITITSLSTATHNFQLDFHHDDQYDSHDGQHDIDVGHKDDGEDEHVPASPGCGEG